MSAMVKDLLNQPAPNFKLRDSSGSEWSLKDYQGKWVVVYFYPKDDTPGCTTEACSIRDNYSELLKVNAIVVGISMDDEASHRKFVASHNLPFTLLSDPDKAALTAFGSWGPKMFGREGIQRKTFIIDPAGVVRKIYGRVTPLGHGAQLINDLKTLQSTSGK